MATKKQLPELVQDNLAENAKRVTGYYDLRNERKVPVITFTITVNGKSEKVTVTDGKFKSALLLLLLGEGAENPYDYLMDDERRDKARLYFGSELCEDAEENPETEHTTIRYLLAEGEVRVQLEMWQLQMFSLLRDRVLITGASGGIGAAIAKSMHRQGAIVGISGTREEALQKLADELGNERVHILPCDLLDPDAVKELPKQAKVAMGSVDTLVNNAGITRDGPALRTRGNDWSDVLRVNLEVPFELSKALYMGMSKNKWGRIINVSSIVGFTGNPGQVNYVTAKSGLGGMTKTLAYEFGGKGVTVNAVAPGFIDTNMTKDVDASDKLVHVPSGRMGTPNEVAAAVVYLASEEASYVNGATEHINGGMAMI